MFTEKDINLAEKLRDDCEEFVKKNREQISDTITMQGFINIFLLRQIAKLQNENKELRSLSSVDHEVNT